MTLKKEPADSLLIYQFCLNVLGALSSGYSLMTNCHAIKRKYKNHQKEMLIFQNPMSEKVWLTSLCMLFTNCYLEIIILKR